MKIYRFNFAPIMAVELPNNETELYFAISKNVKFEGWEPLGNFDDITSEDVADLVEKVMNGQHFQNYNGRKKNDIAKLWCKTALDSFKSGIESEIYTNGNPYELPRREEYVFEHHYELESREHEYNYEKYNEDKDEYDEAEARTFDLSRTIFYKKYER